MSLRPQTLAEVAERAEDLRRFGWEFQDWLHTVRAMRTRGELRRSIAPEPARLKERFAEGAVTDAWLAAYAEYAATIAGLETPAWALAPGRVSPEPWFPNDSQADRQLGLRDSPPAFKNRNLFTPRVDFPLRLRAGRPPKSATEKRRNNAARQQRFRARRALELELLRHTVQHEG